MRAILQQIEAALPPDLPARLGVAVSGGSDSVALLLLLKDLSERRGFELLAVTVDHGLREGSAGEAQWVADRAAQLKVPHRTLVWSDWDGAGNLQDAARQARYRLMAEWAREAGTTTIALGHTQDDQAETVLMRLARGAGVDGLSGMAPSRKWLGVTWLRPLIDCARADLRACLESKGVDWLDDPTNADPRYDRIKARQALIEGAPLGLDARALAEVARNMQSAQAALDACTRDFARAHVALEAGALRIPQRVFDAQPEEIIRRLLAAGVRWMADAAYRPRGRSLRAACAALCATGSATLMGCRMLKARGDYWIAREFAAVAELSTAPEGLWDRRWRVSGPRTEGACIRALGPEGLTGCPEWRALGVPRDVLMCTPALWRNGDLIAAPIAGYGEDWTANLEKNHAGFLEDLVAH